MAQLADRRLGTADPLHHAAERVVTGSWAARGGRATRRIDRTAALTLGDIGRLASLVWLTGVAAAPAAAHDWYSKRQSPQGEECCNRNDCGPVEMRPDPRTGELSLLIGKGWLPVDWRKVLEAPSPDGKAHVCWWPLWREQVLIPQIRCIMLPSAS